ncbi:DUF4162 domain-containing protein, partial [Paenibacillus sepulcri]|nr:DUF4162 domain-containing protein [Paenibacillus sepulcri]
VRKLNESGCTIIYTSHYMEEVEEICSRIAIVDHGKIIAEGTKEQLKATITDVKDIRIELKSAQGSEGERLQGIPGVRKVLQEENILRIHSDAAVDNLNLILKRLMEDNMEIRAVEEQEPNLEMVFLTLTGRKLRD